MAYMLVQSRGTSWYQVEIPARGIKIGGQFAERGMDGIPVLCLENIEGIGRWSLVGQLLRNGDRMSFVLLDGYGKNRATVDSRPFHKGSEPAEVGFGSVIRLYRAGKGNKPLITIVITEAEYADAGSDAPDITLLADEGATKINGRPLRPGKEVAERSYVYVDGKLFLRIKENRWMSWVPVERYETHEMPPGADWAGTEDFHPGDSAVPFVPHEDDPYLSEEELAEVRVATSEVERMLHDEDMQGAQASVDVEPETDAWRADGTTGLGKDDDKSPIISLRDICYSYSSGSSPIFSDLNLKIQAGEMIAICGPSGCGKSTFLTKILLRAVQERTDMSDKHKGRKLPSAQKINDRRLSRIVYRLLSGDHSKSSGSVEFPDGYMGVHAYVPQDEGSLYLANNVINTLRYYSNLFGIPEEHATRIQDNALQAVSLEEFKSASIDSLSGGQKKRVSIALSYMAMDPVINSNGKIMLLDEPDSGLDLSTSMKLFETIKGRVNVSSVPMTVFVVTHDVSGALSVFDKVILLGSTGTGVCYYGKPDEPCFEFFDVSPDESVPYRKVLDVLRERSPRYHHKFYAEFYDTQDEA